jgi:hypothetical protein
MTSGNCFETETAQDAQDVQDAQDAQDARKALLDEEMVA